MSKIVDVRVSKEENREGVQGGDRYVATVTTDDGQVATGSSVDGLLFGKASSADAIRSATDKIRD